MEFWELEKIIKDVYLIVDPGIIRLLCGQVISHRLPIDPVWTFLMAPSSGGKSELLNGLAKVNGVYLLDTLTPQTFVSGFHASSRGEPASFLMQIQSGIILIKDFTTYLGLRRETIDEVNGQMRKIYDGELTKRFGNGVNVEWKGKITMMSGVTSAIQTKSHLSAAMGERFINYAILQPDRLEVALKAQQNVEDKNFSKKRERIQDAFHEYLDLSLPIPTDVPLLPDSFRTEIRELSNISTLARSAVERNWMSREREITFIHYPEMPMRFASQLTGLSTAFSVMAQGELTEMDRNIIYKIALDSIPAQRRVCLQNLTKYECVKTRVLAESLGYPNNTVRLWLEDLVALKLIYRQKAGQADNSADEWWMTEESRAFFSKFEDIPMLQIELPEPTEEENDLERTAKEVFNIGGENLVSQSELPTQ